MLIPQRICLIDEVVAIIISNVFSCGSRSSSSPIFFFHFFSPLKYFSCNVILYQKMDRYHPDKNASNPEASELFKEVAYSYSILSDPEKRRQYDNAGFEVLLSLSLLILIFFFCPFLKRTYVLLSYAASLSLKVFYILSGP